MTKSSRKKPRNKLTQSGRIWGRPVKNADDLIEDMSPLPRNSGYDDTLLTVQAIMNVGKKHAARDAAAIEAEKGHLISEETVRRRMRRIRSNL